MQKKIDFFLPYLHLFRKWPEKFWRHLISNHVIYMKSIWFYLICFYPKNILEKFWRKPFTVRKIIFFGSTVFGLSTNGDLRSHIRLYVLPSHFFSETAHHIFLKFHMKFGFKKLGKIFQEFFWSFSPFWLKTVRNLSFWRKMEVVVFWEPHIIFFYFFAWSICSGVEENTFSLFFGNVKNSPFWPKLTQIWTKFG